MKKIIIYTPTITPRILYTMSVIFRYVAHIPYHLTENIEEFKTFEGGKIFYANETPPLDECLHIRQHPLLLEEKYTPFSPDFYASQAAQGFFKTSETSDIPFDIFASVFYTVSRYEEYDYSSVTTDNHQRFCPESSLLFQKKLLSEPIVNEWTDLLLKQLSKKSGIHISASRKFNYAATYDIDRAFAYKCSSFYKTIGNFIKDGLQLRFSALYKRLCVLLGKAEDPYDIFSFAESWHRKGNIEAVYFFLLGNGNAPDNNNAVNCSLFRQLISELSKNQSVGLHASYRWAINYYPEALKKEKEALENIVEKDVTAIRQHYIKIKFPEYYQNILSAGFTDDYSMGYPQLPGYRAGMSETFPWFDLMNNKITNLFIHPFAVMDSQFYYYSANNLPDILERMTLKAKSSKNQLTTVWHNHLLAQETQREILINHFHSLANS